MVTILPIKDKARVSQIMRTIKDAENNVQVLLMSDNDKELGFVVVDMKSSIIRLLKMEVFGCNNFVSASKEDLVCADSLVRAAASYGFSIGAYKIESKIKGLENYLFTLGFSGYEGKLLISISKFIKICKH